MDLFPLFPLLLGGRVLRNVKLLTRCNPSLGGRKAVTRLNTDQGVQLLSKLKVLLKTLQRSKSDFVVFCAKVANPNHPHTHCNIISSDE